MERMYAAARLGSWIRLASRANRIKLSCTRSSAVRTPPSELRRHHELRCEISYVSDHRRFCRCRGSASGVPSRGEVMLGAAGRGFVLGAAWGAAARIWMRLISNDPEFSWSGTIAILVLAGIAGLSLGLIHGSRAQGRSRWWLLAVVMVLPLFASPGLPFLPAVPGRPGIRAVRHDLACPRRFRVRRLSRTPRPVQWFGRRDWSAGGHGLWRIPVAVARLGSWRIRALPTAGMEPRGGRANQSTSPPAQGRLEACSAPEVQFVA